MLKVMSKTKFSDSKSRLSIAMQDFQISKPNIDTVLPTSKGEVRKLTWKDADHGIDCHLNWTPLQHRSPKSELRVTSSAVQVGRSSAMFFILPTEVLGRHKPIPSLVPPWLPMEPPRGRHSTTCSMNASSAQKVTY